ncbi:hypothetical protein IJ384_02875 [bacterium]|nr:hypothetical protein [bacterium]
MKNKDILIEKYELICSAEYQKIRQFQLENILKLSNSETEPLIIKGMLKTIADTDKWETDFFTAQRQITKK